MVWRKLEEAPSLWSFRRKSVIRRNNRRPLNETYTVCAKGWPFFSCYNRLQRWMIFSSIIDIIPFVFHSLRPVFFFLFCVQFFFAVCIWTLPTLHFTCNLFFSVCNYTWSFSISGRSKNIYYLSILLLNSFDSNSLNRVFKVTSWWTKQKPCKINFPSPYRTFGRFVLSRDESVPKEDCAKR